MTPDSRVCAWRALFGALRRWCAPMVMAAPCAIVASSCARADGQSAAWTLRWAPDTLTAEFALLRTLDDSTVSPADPATHLVRPLNVRAISGRVFVSDIGADRVAEIDTTGSVVRVIGTRGRGPGELFGVGRLAGAGNRLLVAEARNGRVSEFTLEGEFVRTYTSPFAAGALALLGDTAISGAHSLSHFGQVLRATADPRQGLPRPRVELALRDQRWQRMPGHDLIVADSARAFTLDQATGAVCVHASLDAPPTCASLPAELRSQLATYRLRRVEALESALRVQVRAAPLVKDAVRIGPLLALLLPLPDMPVVLIDTDDGLVTPVVLPAGHVPGWVRSARSFAWDGTRFVMVGDDGIGHLYLSRRAPTH